MTPEAVIIGVVCGSTLIVCGLIPGLFWGTVDGLANGIRNFRDSLTSGFPVQPLIRAESPSDRPQPVWLAGLGALIIVLTVLAHLSG